MGYAKRPTSKFFPKSPAAESRIPQEMVFRQDAQDLQESLGAGDRKNIVHPVINSTKFGLYKLSWIQ